MFYIILLHNTNFLRKGQKVKLHSQKGFYFFRASLRTVSRFQIDKWKCCGVVISEIIYPKTSKRMRLYGKRFLQFFIQDKFDSAVGWFVLP